MALADEPSAHRIIVLTEGSSDAEIISESLRVMFPHLVPYFSFMDFAAARPTGGAGSLVQLVKAFTAARISNRVVALFDNDTAAREALQGLKDITLCESMRVIACPPLDLARNYPSLGPTGLQSLDVNGLAASIEMYFGEDVLRRDDGTLTPVQWRGYNEKLKSYQGELLEKERLMRKFRAKLASAPSPQVVLNAPEWQPMRLLLRQIISSFGSPSDQEGA
mgnify:FL=1